MRIHGHGHDATGHESPTYRCWRAMKRRCSDPTYAEYARYGGSGVRVANRWHIFANFLADMGVRPSLGHSIDRIDSSRGYEPGNVRWATITEQNRNQSRNRRVIFRGESMCLVDVARACGLSQGTLSSRLDNGWSLERATSTPVNPSFRRLRGDK